MSFKITKIQKLRQNTADFSDDEPLAAVWAGGLNLVGDLDVPKLKMPYCLKHLESKNMIG
jgi:hypothetical protein